MGNKDFLFLLPIILLLGTLVWYDVKRDGQQYELEMKEQSRIAAKCYVDPKLFECQLYLAKLRRCP